MKQKKQLPRISDSEWKVMEVLWEENPKTSYEITESLNSMDWSPKTIKTLIFRLEKKGVISHEKGRRGHHYFPLYEKKIFVKKESRSLLNKLFDGATGPMLAHFLKNEKLTKKEILELKSLINSIEEEN